MVGKESELENPKYRKYASYAFIIGVFLLLTTGITWCMQRANSLWFHFSYLNWGWEDWLFYISIFFFIATLFLFLSPYLVEQLKVWLNYQINKMIAKSKVYEKKLESKIEIKTNKYINLNNKKE